MGDLVILLNPAFEASLYKNIYSLATSSEIEYPANQPPVLAIFTSKSDWPNGHAFPIGRSLDTWYESTRPSSGDKEEWLFNVKKHPTADESRAIKHTIGFDDDFINWSLDKEPLTNNPSALANSAKEGASKPRKSESRLTDSTPNPASTNLNEMDIVSSHQEELANSVKTAQDQLNENRKPGITTNQPVFFKNPSGGYQCVLRPRPNNKPDSDFHFRPGNPIYNVSVATNIMNGHGDIANSNLLTFLKQFILLTHTNYVSNTLYELQQRK